MFKKQTSSFLFVSQVFSLLFRRKLRRYSPWLYLVLRSCVVIHLFFGQGLCYLCAIDSLFSFCFFSISNSTLLFEQSSHLLTLIVLCRKTKPVNFCWFFFSSHFLCWTDELLLFVIQLCVCFFLPSCSRSFLFLRTTLLHQHV